MAILRFKALPRAQRLKGVSLPESLVLVKGSLYEAWFNALVLSPFYQEAVRKNTFINSLFIILIEIYFSSFCIKVWLISTYFSINYFLILKLSRLKTYLRTHPFDNHWHGHSVNHPAEEQNNQHTNTN